MSRVTAVLNSIMALGFLLILLVIYACVVRNGNRINALEVRLQNMEHLLSLSLSESRPPALTGSTNRVPAFTNEK